MKYLLTSAGILLGLTGFASATTLDFDAATDCTSPDADVVLSLVTGDVCAPWINAGLGTPGIGIHGDGVELLRADFLTSVTEVSVDLGDLGGGDSDLLTLEIFAAGGISLGSTTYLLAAELSEMHTLSLSSVTDIAYAIFGNLDDGGFVAIDNLTYNSEAGPSAVPLPAGAPMLMAGLAAFGMVRRKRK